MPSCSSGSTTSSSMMSPRALGILVTLRVTGGGVYGILATEEVLDPRRSASVLRYCFNEPDNPSQVSVILVGFAEGQSGVSMNPTTLHGCRCGTKSTPSRFNEPDNPQRVTVGGSMRFPTVMFGFNEPGNPSRVSVSAA